MAALQGFFLTLKPNWILIESIYNKYYEYDMPYGLGLTQTDP